MLLGIYNSATYVSANHNLRKLIRKHALESRLLDIIGQAEMEKEIRKTVKEITQNRNTLERYKEAECEFDKKELEKYIDSNKRNKKRNINSNQSLNLKV